MLQTSQSLKLGGLGPNLGGEEWEKAKRKQEQIQEYAKQLRNKSVSHANGSVKRKEQPREKTAREKALEFARNVPRPRVKTDIAETSNSQYGSEQYLVDRIEEEPFDENGVTLKEADLEQLNARHDQYQSEIEKIKAMML